MTRKLAENERRLRESRPDLRAELALIEQFLVEKCGVEVALDEKNYSEILGGEIARSDRSDGIWVGAVRLASGSQARVDAFFKFPSGQFREDAIQQAAFSEAEGARIERETGVICAPTTLVTDDENLMLAIEKLPGSPLDRELWESWAAEQRSAYLDQVAGFLVNVNSTENEEIRGILDKFDPAGQPVQLAAPDRPGAVNGAPDFDFARDALPAAVDFLHTAGAKFLEKSQPDEIARALGKYWENALRPDGDFMTDAGWPAVISHANFSADNHFVDPETARLLGAAEWADLRVISCLCDMGRIGHSLGIDAAVAAFDRYAERWNARNPDRPMSPETAQRLRALVPAHTMRHCVTNIDWILRNAAGADWAERDLSDAVRTMEAVLSR